MNIVLLHSKLSDEEVQRLINEFPQYLFLAPSDAAYKNLKNEEWGKVEIFYGSRLLPEELEKAHQLRWIHSPSPNVNPLCLSEIEKRGNIIITRTKEENTIQIGEYVIGSILAFAKNLFHWEGTERDRLILWDSKWRDSMWTLKDRIFLQIGLRSTGTEVARLAKTFGMRVWGMQESRSFHPFCHKVFTFKELHSVLSHADIVCITLSRGFQEKKWFKKEEFELMKQDSILAVIGSRDVLDEDALEEVANATGKFRGIILDAFYQRPIPPNSKLWNIKNTLITPEVAPRPKSTNKKSYHLLRYNLRQYIHGNFGDMRGHPYKTE